jgi:hypothetical protein
MPRACMPTARTARQAGDRVHAACRWRRRRAWLRTAAA